MPQSETARKAQALLNNQMFQDALHGVEEEIIAELRRSRPEECELRETLYAELRAVDRIPKRLKSMSYQSEER